MLSQLEIQHAKASVAYPQANGQVEFTNKSVLQGTKKMLLEAGKSWDDELPIVLWDHRTTPKKKKQHAKLPFLWPTE